MGDPSEDDIETRRMTRATWIAPVKSPDDLPIDGVADGAMCYVEGDESGEEEVWQFSDGRWSRFA